MAGDDRPILLEFMSRKCGISRKLDAYLAHELQRHMNHQTFRRRRVDVADRPDLFERFGVDQTPALVVVDKGKVAGRLDEGFGPKAVAGLLNPWMRKSDGRFGPREQWRSFL